MSCVEECISERECRKFEEGLNNKVKLAMYKMFGKNVEFKKYLHGVSDAGTRGQERIVLMKSYGVIEVEKENWNVLCVVLSVRV